MEDHEICAWQSSAHTHFDSALTTYTVIQIQKDAPRSVRVGVRVEMGVEVGVGGGG